jgi:hypothetical protein
VRHAALADLVPGAMPKVVGMAGAAADVAPVLALLATASVPTVAIAMGEMGLASRVLALRYPSTLLTFAAPPAMSEATSRARPTAPGQIPLAAMHDVFHCRAIDCATVPFGLFCGAVDFALLARYNALLREAGANAVCVPLPVHGPAEVLHALQALRLVGLRGYAAAPDARGVVAAAGTTLSPLDRDTDVLRNVHPEEQVSAWLAALAGAPEPLP